MKAPRTSMASPHAEHGGADTVERFAEKNGISRSLAFKEISIGRLTARKVGARTIVTHEDAAKWRRALPKASVNGGATKRGDGLPPWLAEPQRERRRVQPKPQEPIEPERDSTK